MEITDIILTGRKDTDESELNKRVTKIGGKVVLYQEQAVCFWGEDEVMNECEWAEYIILN